jgi:hypothetical protein
MRPLANYKHNSTTCRKNCEYEARFKQMSAAASFRILETKTSFLDGGPLPWKYDSDEDSPPPPKE